MGGPDGKIFGPRSRRTDRAPWPSAKYFPVRPDLTQSMSILSHEHRAFPPFFFGGGGGVIKFAIGMSTHVAHFDRKVGIYIATKLFQFTSRKEPYAIPAGQDGFFRPCSRHRVRPSYGDFLNSFAMKAHAGPYGSYDKAVESHFLPSLAEQSDRWKRLIWNQLTCYFWMTLRNYFTRKENENVF